MKGRAWKPALRLYFYGLVVGYGALDVPLNQCVADTTLYTNKKAAHTDGFSYNLNTELVYHDLSPHFVVDLSHFA